MDLDKKIVINMLSSADKVEGQGAVSYTHLRAHET